MNETILKKIAKDLKMRFPSAQISNDLQYSKGVISQYLNGKRELSENFKEMFENFYNVKFSDYENDINDESKKYNGDIEKIAVIDPYSSEEENISENKNGNSFTQLPNGQLLMSMPLIEVEAQAGFLDNYSNVDYLNETAQHSIIVDKEFRGRYVAFRVKGDSMDDDSKNAIANNYIVATRELSRDHWMSKIRYNDFPYWVVYTSESKYPLLKEIVNHDVENGNITFHSLNDSPEYCDFTLNIDEINALFYVIDVNRNINNKSY